METVKEDDKEVVANLLCPKFGNDKKSTTTTNAEQLAAKWEAEQDVLRIPREVYVSRKQKFFLQQKLLDFLCLQAVGSQVPLSATGYLQIKQAKPVIDKFILKVTNPTKTK